MNVTSFKAPRGTNEKQNHSPPHATAIKENELHPLDKTVAKQLPYLPLSTS